MLFASVAFLSPMGEELFFRGLFQRSLSNAGAAPVVAVLASSLLFGAAHGDWVYGAVTFVLGLALGALLLLTGSLLPALIAHIANNAVALLEARELLPLPALFGDPWFGIPVSLGFGAYALWRAVTPLEATAGATEPPDDASGSG
ncbi:MAG: CPBP family intramembrane metalloprotease [Gammaproteobacteria bacterium]|nr:CPBP family intramembrane metalloprotease [Gammaproteobacteria bacterium]NIU03327.1 CPBP family intramembrane metalloprotease [Gammaproteobacteria bacterium]NIX84602.1 CPBP family intramembrane metalloprotease [Gammaproteobacteria bacterium]